MDSQPSLSPRQGQMTPRSEQGAKYWLPHLSDLGKEQCQAGAHTIAQRVQGDPSQAQRAGQP